MVVFRIKGENELTEKLLKRLNHRGKLHCVPSSLKGRYVIRFTVTSTHTTVEDICNDWHEIRVVTAEILAGYYAKTVDNARVTLKGMDVIGTYLVCLIASQLNRSLFRY